MVDHIDFALLALREDPRWQILFEAPHPSRNRLIHFQLAISGSPAFNLVSGRLHRGICSKIAQLGRLDTTTFNDRLGGFVRPLIRTANNIPTGSIRKHLRDYNEGEFDDLIEAVIYSLPRMKFGSNGRSQYAPKTLRKLYSIWVTAFYGTANEKPFNSRSYRPNRSSRVDIMDPHRADELPEMHPLRSPFLAMADQQAGQEDLDLDIAFISKKTEKGPQNRFSSGLKRLQRGKFPVLFVPSTTMPGVLPITVIAIIIEGIDQLAEIFTAQEYQAAKLVIHLLLNTGRPANWLLKIQVGDKPNSPWEVRQPICPANSQVIYHVPEFFPCPPALKTAETAEATGIPIESSKIVYEKVNPIHRVPLTNSTRELMQAFLDVRNATLINQPKEAHLHHCSENSGALFTLRSPHGFLVLNEAWLENLLSILSSHVQRQIPGYPQLRACHFSRSFEGYYASSGLRGVYRFYVSGRAGRRFEMPLRYSRVNFKRLTDEYCQAQVQFSRAIQDQATELRRVPSPPGSRRDQILVLDGSDFEAVHFGSARVPSQAILRSILKDLYVGIDRANTQYGKDSEATTLTRLIVVALGLFNGLRPFEVSRLNRRDIDLASCQITVHGKARWGRQAYRCLPLLPRIVSLIEKLFSLGGEFQAAERKVFRCHEIKSGRSVMLSTKQLDQILEDAAVAEGWPSGPVFYGLRRRFRTDMLSSGMDEPLINYLMGHKVLGEEPFSIYSERRYTKLREQYFRAAGQMVDRYAFLMKQD